MAERFGDFELLTLLSADAALESWLAVPVGGGLRSIVRRGKKSAASQAGFRDLFLQDAQAAMQLSHVNLARVVAVGEVHHLPFLAQEYVEGENLAHVTARARAAGALPLPLPRALGLMLPVLDALASAHAQKTPLLHRDLAPRNIFVTAEGRAVLTDFGLARARRSAGRGLTDAYVSPEQVHGQPLAASSDVFAAALVLFELLCGRLPASGERGEIIARIGAGDLDAALTVNPQLGPVAAVLEAALKPVHTLRPPDAGALAAALRALPGAVDAPEAIAEWLKTLPEVAAEPRLPTEAARAAPVAVKLPANPAVAAPAAPSPPKANRSRTRLGLAAVALGMVVGLGAKLAINASTQPVVIVHDDRTPTRFETTVMSLPAGADVMLDQLAVGKTPYRFTSERDRVYQLDVSNLNGTTSLALQNTTLVEIDALDHRVTREVRLAGSRPKSKQAGKKHVNSPEVVADDGRPAAETVLFAATAPAHFVLGRQHQVRIDETPQLPLKAGTLTEVAVGYRNPSPDPRTHGDLRTYRSQLPAGANRPGPNVRIANAYAPADAVTHLSLLLSRFTDRIELREVHDSPIDLTAVPSWVFVLSERTNNTVEVPPQFKFGEQFLNPGSSSVVVVEGDNRFTVNGLGARPSWTVKLAPVAKGGTVASPVVIRLFAASEYASPFLDETQPESSTAVLVPGASHVVTGAASFWLAIPVVSGFEAAPVEVSVEAR